MRDGAATLRGECMAETGTPETPQESRYAAALRTWEATQGRQADRHERAMLRLVTADAGLWSWIKPRMDAAKGRVDLDDGADAQLNRGQRLLLAAARGLYGQNSPVNLAALADDLDDQRFTTVLTTLRAYRQDAQSEQATH